MPASSVWEAFDTIDICAVLHQSMTAAMATAIPYRYFRPHIPYRNYGDVILRDHLHEYLEVHESAMEAPILEVERHAKRVPAFENNSFGNLGTQSIVKRHNLEDYRLGRVLQYGVLYKTDNILHWRNL